MEIVIALVLSATMLLSLIWWFSQCLVLPPGPWSLPLIGHLHLLWGTPAHKALQALSKRFGPILSLRLGMLPVVVISSHELARELFAAHDEDFSSRPYMIIGDTRYAFQGLASSPYGERWRNIKKLYTEMLFTKKSIDSFSWVRRNEISHAIEAILRSSSSGEPVNVRTLATTLTFNVMSQILMNKRYSEDDIEAMEFKQIIKEVMSMILRPCISNFVPWYLRWIDWQIPYYKQLRSKQDTFLQKIVDDHKRNAATREQKDFIDTMLEYYGQGKQSEVYVRASLVEILLGGTDTSSVTIEWFMAAVIHDQQILAKIQDELDTIVGKARMVQESDLPKLEYFRAVIKETFRLYPSAPLLMPRISNQAHKLGGYDIPKGTTLLLNSWAIGTNPEVWERPTEFLPERFLGSSIDVQGQDYELLPFGSGRRKCPGLPLGLRTVELFVSNLVHGFDWSPVPGTILSMEEEFASACQLKTPLQAVAKPRLPKEIYAIECSKNSTE